MRGDVEKRLKVSSRTNLHIQCYEQLVVMLSPCAAAVLLVIEKSNDPAIIILIFKNIHFFANID